MAEEKKANSFDIRKIYIKDASLESPNAPDIFLSEPTTPDVNVDASIRATALKEEDYYEVVLGITVTSKMGEKTAFLAEVQQAGVFFIVGIPEDDMPLALEIACPNVLLPFAREAIAELVAKGGFPQLLLSPINFESIYQQKLQHKANEAAGSANGEASNTH